MTTLPANGCASDATVSAWPSQGTAMMTRSAPAAYALSPPVRLPSAPGKAAASSRAAVSPRGTEREPAALVSGTPENADRQVTDIGQRAHIQDHNRHPVRLSRTAHDAA